MTPRPASICLAALVLLRVGAASAQAQAPAAAAKAAKAAKAEAVFREGQRLFAQKHYEEACPKLAYALSMAPTSAAAIALGFCYEAQGKTASAWAAYNAVLPLTKRDGRGDRARVATGRAKALNSRLSRMTFTLDAANANIHGLEVRDDGVLLDKNGWADRPVDPGEHDISVQAPGYVTYSTKYTIGTSAGQETLAIPRLVSEQGSPAPLAEKTAPPATPSTPIDIPWRTVGIVTGSVGAASVLIGAVLGGVALSKVNAAQKACPASPCGDAGAVAENGTGGSLANASTGMFVVGGVLVGAGVLAYFFAPAKGEKAPDRELHGEPVVSLGYLGWRGTF